MFPKFFFLQVQYCNEDVLLLYVDHRSFMQRFEGVRRRNILNCPSLAHASFMKIELDGVSVVNKAQKPIALGAEFLKGLPTGSVVLDAFAGTGSVARAAIASGLSVNGAFLILVHVLDGD